MTLHPGHLYLEVDRPLAAKGLGGQWCRGLGVSGVDRPLAAQGGIPSFLPLSASAAHNQRKKKVLPVADHPLIRHCVLEKRRRGS